MKLKIFSFVLLLTLFSCKNKDNGTILTTSSKPNILLIIGDDMGIEATPGYSIGAIKPNMPNLASLALNGVTYENAWSYPICSPTRASILTGKYGYRTGVLNVTGKGTINTNEKSLQQYLKDNNSGYSSAIIGKWHLSKNASDATTMGVDYYAGLVIGAVSDYNDWQLNENGVNALSTEYCTKKFTDLGIDWIKKQNNPWFCWMAYTAPHTPFHLPPSYMHSQGNLPTDEASIDANPVPYFMAMMESLDYEMGRILDSLPENVRENTIVIFIGDNGSHKKVLQSPYSKAQSKGSLYQGGTLVPLIVSGKGVSRSGERETRLIQTTDLFTTIAEIAGIDKDSYEDSYSFYNTFTTPDNSTDVRKYNYTEIDPIGYAIRNNKYKLIKFDDGSAELYNLSADPNEKSDLLGGTLSQEEEDAKTELENAAADIRK